MIALSRLATWGLVIPAWLALSVVVGVLVGRFIRLGEGADERRRHW